MKVLEMKEELLDVVANSLGVKRSEINEGSQFVEDLGADSLDLTEMVVNLEEKFGVKVDNDDVIKFKTVKDVLTYLEQSKKG